MPKEIDIQNIRLDREGMKIIVSELEADLMAYLWKKGPSTVREIHEHFGKRKKVALTTIGVTLDRMYSKNLVDREIAKGRGGLRYIYKAGVTKEELGKSIAKTLVKKLSSTFGSSFSSTFLSHFNQSKKKRKN